MIKKRGIISLLMLICLVCLGHIANAKDLGGNNLSRAFVSDKGIVRTHNTIILPTKQIHRQEIAKLEREDKNSSFPLKTITSEKRSVPILTKKILPRPSKQIPDLTSRILRDFRDSEEGNMVSIEIYRQDDIVNPIWISESIETVRNLRDILLLEGDFKLIIIEANSNLEVETREYALSILRL
jgi:hypothetical protein